MFSLGMNGRTYSQCFFISRSVLRLDLFTFYYLNLNCNLIVSGQVCVCISIREFECRLCSYASSVMFRIFLIGASAYKM